MTRRVSHCGSRSSAFARRVSTCASCAQLARVRPHGVDRRADRERIAVAIEDHAAVRRELGDAREARIALLLEEALVDDLQVDCARDEQRHGRERQREQRRARERARLRTSPRSSCDRVASWLARCAVPTGRGITMCRSSRAIRSTRPCVPQVLCSSWSWPHSMSSSSRSRVRRCSSMKWLRACVLAVDDRERRPEQQRPRAPPRRACHAAHAHAASRSATRSTALRARGLRATLRVATP